MNINTGRTGRVVAALVAITTVAGLLSGCTAGQLDPNRVVGSGHVITEQRQVSGLDEVVLAMSGDLTIEQSGTEGLTIEGEDNIVPLITTDVSGNRLTIGTKSGSSFSTTRPIRIHLTVKSISYIGDTASGGISAAAIQGDRLQTEAGGSGSVTLTNVTAKDYTAKVSGSGGITIASVQSDSLQTQTTGSGSITLTNLSAKNYTAKMSGSGGITASGSTDNLDVTGSGSGSFDGRNLQSKSAKVALSGSGSASLRVSDTLDASVSGSGSVRYLGNPTVTKHDTGSGEIIELR